jgi:hypothetical protein
MQYKLYTVYNNKTDMPVIVDGTAVECARAMELKNVHIFYSTVGHVRKGVTKKWAILERKKVKRKKAKSGKKR